MPLPSRCTLRLQRFCTCFDLYVYTLSLFLSQRCRTCSYAQSRKKKRAEINQWLLGGVHHGSNSSLSSLSGRHKDAKCRCWTICVSSERVGAEAVATAIPTSVRWLHLRCPQTLGRSPPCQSMPLSFLGRTNLQPRARIRCLKSAALSSRTFCVFLCVGMRACVCVCSSAGSGEGFSVFQLFYIIPLYIRFASRRHPAKPSCIFPF